jgi:hypothetical protein
MECGVSERALRYWLDEGDERFNPEFARAFKTAQSDAIKVLMKLATSTPQGAQWALERMYPKLFRLDLIAAQSVENDDAGTSEDATEELVNQRVAERLREIATAKTGGPH